MNADDVKASAQAAASGEAGRLRIGFIGSVTFGLMPRLIHAFSERYPKVKLELTEATNEMLLNGIDTDAFDLVFLRVPTAQPPEISVQIIQEDEFTAAIPVKHMLAKKHTLCMQDFADQALIGYVPSRVGGLHAALTQVLLHAGVTPRITQEAVQVHTVIGLVESGLGLALIPSGNTEFASERVVFRRIRDLPKVSPIGIALAFHSARETPAAKRFRDLATELNGL